MGRYTAQGCVAQQGLAAVSDKSTSLAEFKSP